MLDTVIHLASTMHSVGHSSNISTFYRQIKQWNKTGLLSDEQFNAIVLKAELVIEDTGLLQLASKGYARVASVALDEVAKAIVSMVGAYNEVLANKLAHAPIRTT
jgi:hypothetical protein